MLLAPENDANLLLKIAQFTFDLVGVEPELLEVDEVSK